MTTSTAKTPDLRKNAGYPKRPKSAHALGLPNLLTYLRILLIPALTLAFFLTGLWGNVIALILFLIAGASDYLDGHFARSRKQFSSLGRMLDPIADKLLVCAVLLMLAGTGVIAGLHLFAALIILTREILVSGLREHLAQFNVIVPVTPVAKWKTGIQMTALGFLIAGEAGEIILPGAMLIGFSLLWIAATLTLYTGYGYIKAGFAHFTDESNSS